MTEEQHKIVIFAVAHDANAFASVLDHIVFSLGIEEYIIRGI